MKLRGKYIADLGVAQRGDTIILTFKDPTRNKNKNSVYYVDVNNNFNLVYLGACSIGLKEGMANVAILSDGTVLMFSTPSLSGAGADCELHVEVLPTKVPVAGNPNFTPVTVSITHDDIARTVANNAQNTANSAKTNADTALNRVTSLEKRLSGELKERDLSEQEILDRIWVKAKDSLYDELSKQESGVVGMIKRIIREELRK
jgi:hypothetical protein